MALAIGVWLYDTDPSYHKQSVDTNAAMLKAFAVNKSDVNEAQASPYRPHHHDPYKAIVLSSVPEGSGSNADPVLGDMSWLLE